MIIGAIKEEKKLEECPHCGHAMTPRQLSLNYCEKCYQSLEETDEDGNRKVRFHVL